MTSFVSAGVLKHVISDGEEVKDATFRRVKDREKGSQALSRLRENKTRRRRRSCNDFGEEEQVTQSGEKGHFTGRNSPQFGRWKMPEACAKVTMACWI